MIRGRLLDAAGTPAVRCPIKVLPWGGPHEWPAAGLSGTLGTATDAQGRFWLVRLPPGLYDLAVPMGGFESLVGGVGLLAGPEERTVRARAGEPISGRLVDEAGAPVPAASVDLMDAGPVWWSYRRATTSADGAFRFEDLDPLRDHRLRAVVMGPGGSARGGVVENVRGGAHDLVIRLGDPHRLRFRVDASGRGGCEADVRLVRISGGPVLWIRDSGNPVDLLAAPIGTWRVLVRARDLDAEGVPLCAWVEAGTATTGAPETTLVVPP
jgi:hypothetical protein